MKCVMNCAVLLGFLCALPQMSQGADRLTEFKKLNSEYEDAVKKYYKAPVPKERTTAEQIRRWESWPGWRYIPRVVALAEAKPDDEAAFRCCQWIIDRTNNIGNWHGSIFEADQKAWAMLAAHHTRRPDLPALCLQAVLKEGPAQEKFLRGLLKRTDLSHECKGFATVALGELLARKFNKIERLARPALPRDEFGKYLQRRKSPDYGKDIIPANASKFKAESTQIFRDALKHYADVPVTITAPSFRNLKNLGEKAGKSLYALEHLTMGSKLPNVVGKDLQGRPLDLNDYRGRVVVISAWFTGCGPCMGMIPQELRLIKTYKGRPFVLLGVCTDETIDEARKTADEHNMNWPCWFDGQNGPIARNLNVLAWPTIYVLDHNGRIVAKNIRGDELDQKVAELMAKTE